jgi:hypothetical protein
VLFTSSKSGPVGLPTNSHRGASQGILQNLPRLFCDTQNALYDTHAKGNAKVRFNKYKTFYVLSLIYSYINTSGNWENEKLCGNMTPEGRSVFTHFRVFPISTSVDITIYQYGKNVLYLFYNIAQRNIKKEIFRRFRVDIELYQHGS